ncbi:MAG: response regulator, partial [Oscillospiraceae bacterium]|nr:response regulator [Oscillospiraceae bacterium]
MPNILIIDDDASISEMLSEALENEGYTVSKAYSGTEAMMFLSQSQPDLVLLDLMLPGLSGEELLPHIKDIPVMVLS